jgi:RimJ/RimL family protein N-acetyltransferase
MLETPGTAWIGIRISEEAARGKGLGRYAMRELEAKVAEAGLKRNELGVFEFNAPAIGLYRSLGYREIGRIDAFAYWKDRLWQDIRMERILTP